MNRRGFFKTVAGFVAGIFVVGKASEGKLMTKVLETKQRYEALVKNIDANEKRVLAQGRKKEAFGWKFYINSEEIDSNRAVDKYGSLRWPFKGAKHGDMCKAQSPTVSGSWQRQRNKYLEV